MRAIILFLALVIAVGVFPILSFAASGDYRSKVDQAHKRTLQSERRSDQRLKAIEREAAREIGSVDSSSASKNGSGRKAK
jgi:hypothetical protein